MAERTLRLVFANAADSKKEVTISVPLSDDTKGASDIKNAMDVVYANKGIFSLNIGLPKEAAFVTPLSLTPVNING